MKKNDEILRLGNQLDEKRVEYTDLEGQFKAKKQELDANSTALNDRIQQLTAELNESKQNYSKLKVELSEMEKMVDQIRDDSMTSSQREILKN